MMPTKRQLFAIVAMIALALCVSAFGGEAYRYDPDNPAVPNRIIGKLGQGDTNKLKVLPNVLIYADNLKGVPQGKRWKNYGAAPAVDVRYWKRDGTTIVEMTAAEKQAIDAWLAEQVEAAKEQQASLDADQALVRAIARALKDQFPDLDLPQFRRDFIRHYKSALP